MWQRAESRCGATGVSRVPAKMRLGVSPVPRHSVSACLRIGVHDDRARGEDLRGSQRATPSNGHHTSSKGHSTSSKGYSTWSKGRCTSSKGHGTAGDDTLCGGTLVPTVRATTTPGAMRTVGRNARQCEHFPAAHDRPTLAAALTSAAHRGGRSCGRRTAHGTRCKSRAARCRAPGPSTRSPCRHRRERARRPRGATRSRASHADGSLRRPTADRSVLRTSGRDWSENK